MMQGDAAMRGRVRQWKKVGRHRVGRGTGARRGRGRGRGRSEDSADWRRGAASRQEPGFASASVLKYGPAYESGPSSGRGRDGSRISGGGRGQKTSGPHIPQSFVSATETPGEQRRYQKQNGPRLSLNSPSSMNVDSTLGVRHAGNSSVGVPVFPDSREEPSTPSHKNSSSALAGRPFSPSTPSHRKSSPASGCRNSPKSNRLDVFDDYLSHDAILEGLGNGGLVRGGLRINKRNRFSAFVTPVGGVGKEKGAEDIFISGTKHRNRALDGDIVIVEILKEEELATEMAKQRRITFGKKQDEVRRMNKVTLEDSNGEEAPKEEGKRESDKEFKVLGKVVFIWKAKDKQRFTGVLCLEQHQGLSQSPAKSRPPRIIWFKPSDLRVPLIAIPIEQAPKSFLESPSAFATTIWTAMITRWNKHSLYPLGVVCGPLGQMGELAVETEALLEDAGCNWGAFSESVMDCLPDIPWSIPSDEVANRRDFRDHRTFSIDPQTAKDLDDAMSCTSLPDGTFEVGVHIADVSQFVPRGSALDEEARNRASTVYLVQKAIPMLPRLLCEELCSLNPGVERFAFSVVWKMDKDAAIIGQPWFGKSIIKSCAKMSYDHAQAFIEDRDWADLPHVDIHNGHTLSDVKQDVLTLFNISKALRRARFENGALKINSIKLWFALDENGNPENLGVYQQKEANKLIEEVRSQ